MNELSSLTLEIDMPCVAISALTLAYSNDTFNRYLQRMHRGIIFIHIAVVFSYTIFDMTMAR